MAAAALTTEADRILCYKLYECFYNNFGVCAFEGDPTLCYCGFVARLRCFSIPGAADGTCVAQFEAAAKSTDPSVSHDHFVDDSPSGRAVDLYNCRATSAPPNATFLSATSARARRISVKHSNLSFGPPSDARARISRPALLGFAWVLPSGDGRGLLRRIGQAFLEREQQRLGGHGTTSSQHDLGVLEHGPSVGGSADRAAPSRRLRVARCRTASSTRRARSSHPSQVVHAVVDWTWTAGPDACGARSSRSSGTSPTITAMALSISAIPGCPRHGLQGGLPIGVLLLRYIRAREHLHARGRYGRPRESLRGGGGRHGDPGVRRHRRRRAARRRRRDDGSSPHRVRARRHGEVGLGRTSPPCPDNALSLYDLEGRPHYDPDRLSSVRFHRQALVDRRAYLGGNRRRPRRRRHAPRPRCRSCS